MTGPPPFDPSVSSERCGVPFGVRSKGLSEGALRAFGDLRPDTNQGRSFPSGVRSEGPLWESAPSHEVMSLAGDSFGDFLVRHAFRDLPALLPGGRPGTRRVLRQFNCRRRPSPIPLYGIPKSGTVQLSDNGGEEPFFWRCRKLEFSGRECQMFMKFNELEEFRE
jgi:hypothetical protein